MTNTRHDLRANPPADHFDPTKYRPNGLRLVVKAGRRSKLNQESAEQALYLEQLVRAATRDLKNFLFERGYVTKHAQAAIMKRLRNGWRPRR